MRNPDGRVIPAVVTLNVPRGWKAEPDRVSLALGPADHVTARFTVTPPRELRARRVRLAADYTVGERRFGQVAEALVNVE
jgi:hypothetical protein